MFGWNERNCVYCVKLKKLNTALKVYFDISNNLTMNAKNDSM